MNFQLRGRHFNPKGVFQWWRIYWKLHAPILLVCYSLLLVAASDLYSLKKLQVYPIETYKTRAHLQKFWYQRDVENPNNQFIWFWPSPKQKTATHFLPCMSKRNRVPTPLWRKKSNSCNPILVQNKTAPVLRFQTPPKSKRICNCHNFFV